MKKKYIQLEAILTKIIDCIYNFIDKNIHNTSLIESKLLAINNFLIDNLDIPNHTNEYIQNSPMKIARLNFLPSSDKMKFQKLFSPRTTGGFQFRGIQNKKSSSINEKTNTDLNDRNDQSNPPKLDLKKQLSLNKIKIKKLKKLMEEEKQQNAKKEILYLKELYLMKTKLNFYETKNFLKNDNSQHLFKSISCLNFINSTSPQSKSNLNKNILYKTRNKDKVKNAISDDNNIAIPKKINVNNIHIISGLNKTYKDWKSEKLDKNIFTKFHLVNLNRILNKNKYKPKNS